MSVVIVHHKFVFIYYALICTDSLTHILTSSSLFRLIIVDERIAEMVRVAIEERRVTIDDRQEMWSTRC